MKRRVITFLIALTMLAMSIATLARATPVNLNTFAPAGMPICTLMGQAASFNSGVAFPGAITANVGETITISLVVTNGSFPGPNDLIVNGSSFNYGVTLPIQVTTTAAGEWDITFVTVGCKPTTLSIVTH